MKKLEDINFSVSRRNLNEFIYILKGKIQVLQKPVVHLEKYTNTVILYREEPERDSRLYGVSEVLKEMEEKVTDLLLEIQNAGILVLKEL